MSRFRMCVLLIVSAVLAGALAAEEPSSRPATQPSPAKQALQSVLQLMEMPQPRSMAEFKTEINKRMPKVLQAVAEMEKQHGDSEEIHEVRLLGLVAATRLMSANNDAAMASTAEQIARKILQSGAPADKKLFADAHLVLLTIRPVGPASGSATRPAKDPAEAVREFVRRHDKGKDGAEAYAVGTQLAREIRDRALFTEIQDALVKKYPEHPTARQILRQRGLSPDVGKPFKAELTKLDGSKLKLPDDLLGKVVVVDFWATWCGPCISEIPHMKQLYAKYRQRGVEFVGISLDDDLDRLKSFVAARGMGWVHTFSGKKWQDPTARSYGVSSIPSIWVVGKDGKVVSDNARARLSSTILRALSAPAPGAKPKPGV